MIDPPEDRTPERPPRTQVINGTEGEEQSQANPVDEHRYLPRPIVGRQNYEVRSTQCCADRGPSVEVAAQQRARIDHAYVVHVLTLALGTMNTPR